MSFALVELHRIQAVGGPTLAVYERLTREAEGAQAGSPAAVAKRSFEMSWCLDSARVIAMCEAAAPESNVVPFPTGEAG